MAGLSPNEVVDGGLLSEVRLPPPKELTKVTDVPEEDDKNELLKRVLKENASFRQRIAELEEEKKKSKDLQFMVDMRQLFNNFRRSPHGRSILGKLLDHARTKFPEFDGTSWDSFLPTGITSFSTMVIDLVKLKDNLQEAKDLNTSSDCLSKIKTISNKLIFLQTAAKTFKTADMPMWDQTVGEGVYACCLLVAAANNACHPDVTKEFLSHMSNRACSRECKYGDVEIGPALKAIIRDIRAFSRSDNS